jgi:hypothetical protein
MGYGTITTTVINHCQRRQHNNTLNVTFRAWTLSMVFICSVINLSQNMVDHICHSNTCFGDLLFHYSNHMLVIWHCYRTSNETEYLLVKRATEEMFNKRRAYQDGHLSQSFDHFHSHTQNDMQLIMIQQPNLCIMVVSCVIIQQFNYECDSESDTNQCCTRQMVMMNMISIQALMVPILLRCFLLLEHNQTH